MAVGELVTREGFTLSAKIRTLIIQTSADSGTFVTGETVTGGTSSATAEVVLYDLANTELVVALVTGTFQASETVTGGTSGATATTVGTPAVGYPTAWTTVNRVRDQFNVNRQRAVTEIFDFDSDETDFADKVRGVQSASASFTINLVPGNDGFRIFEAAMDYDKDVALKRVQTDRDGTNTRTRYYVGGVSGFNESDSVTDASSVGATFDLSDVSLTDPTV